MNCSAFSVGVLLLPKPLVGWKEENFGISDSPAYLPAQIPSAGAVQRGDLRNSPRPWPTVATQGHTVLGQTGRQRFACGTVGEA